VILSYVPVSRRPVSKNVLMDDGRNLGDDIHPVTRVAESLVEDGAVSLYLCLV
jgi:hypothetical protein